jgi:hypothetical protein
MLGNFRSNKMKKSPLIVSVPAGELAHCEIPATVFPVKQLLAGSISAPLRCALGIVQQAFGKKYSALWCVARPEMFVEASTLGWLKARLDGARDHVCLTDGHALKAIPGLHNRLFFYAGEWVGSANNLRNSLRRAPEMLSQFHGTINDQGAIFAEFPDHTLEPEILLAKVYAEKSRLGWTFPLYSNPHSHEDSANRMLARGDHSAPRDLEFREADFELVICTEVSLQDLNFCRVIARKINDAAFSAVRRLVIQLPELEPCRNGNIERMVVFLGGLARSGVAIPRAYLSGVQLVSDLSVIALENTEAKKGKVRYHLTIPQSLSTWRHAGELFSSAKSVNCYMDETKHKMASTVTGSLRKMIGCPTKFEGWKADSHRRNDGNG